MMDLCCLFLTVKILTIVEPLMLPKLMICILQKHLNSLSDPLQPRDNVLLWAMLQRLLCGMCCNSYLWDHLFHEELGCDALFSDGSKKPLGEKVFSA